MSRKSIKQSLRQTAPEGDVRRAVLDGALEVIATSGPDALSMRDIARRAGVSHQAPYHYFGDRAGILAAIAEEGFTKFADALSLEIETSANPVVDCLTAYVKFALNHPGHYRVMFRSEMSGVKDEQSSAHIAAERAFVALLRLAALANPHPTPDEAMFTPISLWAQAHGIATLLLDGPLASKLPADMKIEDFITGIGNFYSKEINVTAH